MKKRVFSGARPTARQHIGNLLGAIDNYVNLQKDYDCVYCIVDIHALTTLQDTAQIQNYIRELALDWLAAGLDPHKSIIFVQSHVPEVTELHTYLSMVTPLSWLLRVPTFKEKAKAQPDNVNYGLVGYPVLMASDIVLYKAEVVPVGEDQLPHLELTREIARRFNGLFGETFPEPKAKLTSFPNIPSLISSGKMSKSEAGSTIDIAHTAEETTARIMNAITDPARKFRKDPGHPEVCNIYTLHKYFTPAEKVEKIGVECRKAEIGCVDCKKLLSANMNEFLRPLREKRSELAARPEFIKEVLADGADRARVIARETIREVKQKMGLL
ncbi:MAG: tryptophan--tRNA ligase [Dehalococcoidales bacterium]|nr:tryptophan--tRNA ligase [Dehalococcoidales bacterium]